MKVRVLFVGFAALALIVLAGCHEIGHVDDYRDYGGSGRNDLTGEVRDVDTRARVIQLRSDNGRTWRVRYDNGTRVIYGNRDLAPYNLERGDHIAMRGERDGDGRYYAETITVRETSQDRDGWFGRSTARLDTLDGTVEQVYPRRASFELRDRRRLIVVALPADAPRRINDRFNRLAEGDRVRVEGRFVGPDRFELASFR